ncbi:EAL domain-containing protein [Sulfurimonas sp. HSL-1656]|uniref:bifunctional diguanylate cyclase/phosphodiesterase n=1 Tax=Thiomicrolovo subterrani TaxID=3131934 RepID=UPI0031F8A313
MTLFKEITLAMSVLVVALLAMTMFSNYRTNVRFIEDQLYTSARNTASSLGLAISKASDGEDVAMAETMINAVFDSGLYEGIVYRNVDGKILYDRHTPLTLDTVPEWFANSIALPPAVASVPVGKEWMLVGRLQIEGHRGQAYTQMWEAFKEVIASFVILSVIAMAGIFFMLKVVLRSLEAVREQAEAVSGNRFIIQDSLPRTKEIRDVVQAINTLVYKVKEVYKQEADAVARYNTLLYEDRQTHLKNRDFFMMKLGSLVSGEDRFSSGYVAAFQLCDPDKVKHEEGGYVLQKVLSFISDIARGIVNGVEEGVACRVREFDVMLIIPSLEESEVTGLLTSAAESCRGAGYCVTIAATPYRAGEAASELLSHLDYALMQAEAERGTAPFIYRAKHDNVPSWGHDAWRKHLRNAMKLDHFVAFYQPVVSRNGLTVQQELLLRLELEGSLLNAGAFIPVVGHLELQEELDRYVLDKVGETLHASEIAVNVSGDFIAHSATMGWLAERKSAWETKKLELSFEVSNSTVMAEPETAATFSAFVQKQGWRFGIDHFTVESEKELTFLQRIKPSYLKIDAVYLLSLVGSEGKREAALFTIARLIDIELIATGVDSEETADRLHKLGIDLLQGFWIGEPAKGAV